MCYWALIGNDVTISIQREREKKAYMKVWAQALSALIHIVPHCSTIGTREAAWFDFSLRPHWDCLLTRFILGIEMFSIPTLNDTSPSSFPKSEESGPPCHITWFTDPVKLELYFCLLWNVEFSWSGRELIPCICQTHTFLGNICNMYSMYETYKK